MLHKFFKIGDEVTMGKDKVRIVSDCVRGNHEVEYLTGPHKGQTVKVAYTVLK